MRENLYPDGTAIQTQVHMRVFYYRVGINLQTGKLPSPKKRPAFPGYNNQFMLLAAG